MRISVLILLLFIVFFRAMADEGMWIPMLLGNHTYEEMKKKGFKLSPEDIYSINKASMKDAVVLFGRGCTGEFVSESGLLLTNHHCGYGSIQRHSTLEHDYLTDGFWAKEFKDELPNQGLTVSILVRMEDVTSLVLNNVPQKCSEEIRSQVISKAIEDLVKKNSENKKYSVEVKPFYYGNQYFMFVYQVFRDVRLVGAPPSSIGKFGGDTDNWMWPRHTGDFSIFRVYADKNNEPADYSPDNVPYVPKKHFKINISGVKEGDFTMVFGFPGHTQEYIPSYAVELIQNVENPHQIRLRDLRLEVIKSAMDTNRLIRIQYSNKQAGIANAWKKWIGETNGLKRLKTIEKKRAFEIEFDNWANIDIERSYEYGTLMSEYKKVFNEISTPTLVETYYFEGIMGVEIIAFAKNLQKILQSKTDDEIKNNTDNFVKSAQGFFKNYNQVVDKHIFAKIMTEYFKTIDANNTPPTLLKLQKKFKNDWFACANYIYEKSLIADLTKVEALKKLAPKKIKSILSKDIFYSIWNETAKLYSTNILPITSKANIKIDSLHRLYMKAQREMLPDKNFYPDANLTLRLSYGNVSSYDPQDGIHYDWFTTLDGVMEKEDSTIYDYDIPNKLKELWKKKDFGPYADNGLMHTCFIANNHTTGGNSGSPVLNANGELIGINFDRTWESTMSDIQYDPQRCRNVVLDIRYVLFIVDKYAGNERLMKEMEVIR
ncbi:MAG TPA: S46 family peptidase [Bacteroidales bacterium]|nr:S46 family peptidase [Bacteroidales bacterium]